MLGSCTFEVRLRIMCRFSWKGEILEISLMNALSKGRILDWRIVLVKVTNNGDGIP